MRKPHDRLHGSSLRAADGCPCHRCAVGHVSDPMGLRNGGVPVSVKSLPGLTWDAQKLFTVVKPLLITEIYGSTCAANLASNGVPDYVFDMLCIKHARAHPSEVLGPAWFELHNEFEDEKHIFGPYLPWSARTIRAMIAMPDWEPPAACGMLRQDETLVDQLMYLVSLGFAPRSTRAQAMLAQRMSLEEVTMLRVAAAGGDDDDDLGDES